MPDVFVRASLNHLRPDAILWRPALTVGRDNIRPNLFMKASAAFRPALEQVFGINGDDLPVAIALAVPVWSPSFSDSPHSSERNDGEPAEWWPANKIHERLVSRQRYGYDFLRHGDIPFKCVVFR